MPHSSPARRPRPRGVRSSRALAAGTTALAATAAAIAATATSASATPSAGMVVSQVYGGGGNSGATYTNDYVELTNRGSSAQSLAGWSVQYLSGSGSGGWKVTPLTGSAAAGADYLVAEAAGSGGTTALPPADATGSIAMSATAGTIALVRSTSALTCTTATACASESSIVDLVGFGAAAVYEGAPATGASNTAAELRTSAADSDHNNLDFAAGTPAPRAGGATPTTRIHDIQGTTGQSPLANTTVADVPGIVTAVRRSGSSKGFWFQDPDPDSNPATSEGLFVYTGSTPTVTVGDAVTVSGTVKEYFPGSDASVLSVTELTSPTVTVVSSGNTPPAPILIGPNTVPDTYAPDLGHGDLETAPIVPSRSALDYYESIEGMAVAVQDVPVVGPSNSYGEQYVTTKPGRLRTYRGGTQLLAENATPAGRLEIATLDGSNLAVSVGDTIAGTTAGVLDYSAYGGYTLDAATLGTVQKGNLAPTVTSPARRKQLSIATYNVENLAPGDAAGKYTSLAQAVVKNLASPDVIAVEEVQDNTGSRDDGTVAADQTIAKLTAAIAANGGPSYAAQEIDPVNDQDGGQPGGNIRNVFLYNPARVSFVPAGGTSVDRSTTATRVVKSRGHAALTLSPGRIDPTNPVWTASRKPLVGQFRFGGQDVFVIANHFDAKLGDENADGRYQYPNQSSAIQRAGQAAAVHDFVAGLESVDKKAQVVVVGDLNDYQFSPALKVLTTGTAAGTGRAALKDLITTLPADQQYTYVYDGISQVLDHILVSPAVRGVRYQVVHVNSEFANQTSDHDPQVVDITP